jgi:tryptophan-rich sensory protein
MALGDHLLSTGMGYTFLSALAGAVALIVLMAGAEALLSGQDLQRWLASLKKPKLYAPMALWIVVAIATYFLQGVIAYRLLSGAIDVADWIAFAALVTVMAANVAYNVVLARRQEPRVAYTGIIYFVFPLAFLQVVLFFADPPSAFLNLIYLAWVVGYGTNRVDP